MGSWHRVGLETWGEQVVRTSPPPQKKRVKKTGLNHAGAEDTSAMITLEVGSSYHCKPEFTS